MNTFDPVHTDPEALERIAQFAGSPVDFMLSVHKSLLDPLGLNMAVITDRILDKGWEPDGFTQHSGWRSFGTRNSGSALLPILRSNRAQPVAAADRLRRPLSFIR